MAYRGQGQKVQKVMVQPINLIFRYLQNGFDEYMNLVLDDAEEIHSKTKSRKQLALDLSQPIQHFYWNVPQASRCEKTRSQTQFPPLILEPFQCPCRGEWHQLPFSLLIDFSAASSSPSNLLCGLQSSFKNSCLTLSSLCLKSFHGFLRS
ncbi:small nuclear ribonucleoprotein E isoform X2 [Equus przewalskii]|uniref:Small nuclear ribonucleoprotein E n=1 Tax=Equus przewalskii TaxID=9798 RepID=A0ABM4NIN0_EQUPR|nr:small nuclear ribonucleoprotein E isoform X2 [Equus caballus]